MICVKQQAGGRGTRLLAIKSFNNPSAVPVVWHSAVDEDVLAVRSACKERQERQERGFDSSKKSKRKECGSVVVVGVLCWYVRLRRSSQYGCCEFPTKERRVICSALCPSATEGTSSAWNWAGLFEMLCAGLDQMYVCFYLS